jgi:glutaredoxin
MKPKAAASKSTWHPTLFVLALLGLALPAAAQYKVVGPDGRITYTDRPPSDAAARVTTISRSGVNEVPAPQDGLPVDLRQTATRYPVTLYSAADCPPCDAARQLLVQRGVPFTEKLIVSNDDAAAMERVLGARTVPSLTIGSQALRGLSESDWTAYLDAAGYPRESRLPKNWQAPAAAPMVARSSPRPASAPAAASVPARSAPAAAVPAVPVVPPAPAGIRF